MKFNDDVTDLTHIEHKIDVSLFYDEHDKFRAALFAGNLVFELFDEFNMTGINRGILVMKDTGEIYRFNGRYYEPDGETFIKGKMQKLLGVKINTYHKNEVINWVKDCEELQADREIFNTHPEKIQLDNCLYDIISGEIDKADPGMFQTTYFPIHYDPDATCEVFLEFLEQVLYKDDIPIIQEMFGYCFYKPYVYQKAFMMVGSGANGKSTLLSLLTTLLGDWNISSIPLQNLCKDRFTNIDLYGKYANVCSELSDKGLKNTGTFKMLTGGDYIRAEKKFKPNGILFKNTAKLVFSCNVIPESDDDTEAYHRRWVVIEFPNQFKEDDPNTDPFIKDKLTKEKELSGIFNWAMEGLKRLLKNGRFSDHRTLEDVKEFMKEHQDPVNQFCMQCLTIGEHEDIVNKSRMYKHYLDFCKLFGKPTVAMNQFSMKLKQYAPRTLSEGQTRQQGRVWHGVVYTGPRTEEKPDTQSFGERDNEKLAFEEEKNE
jgi:putative DNA primase/helicase